MLSGWDKDGMMSLLAEHAAAFRSGRVTVEASLAAAESGLRHLLNRVTALLAEETGGSSGGWTGALETDGQPRLLFLATKSPHLSNGLYLIVHKVWLFLGCYVVRHFPEIKVRHYGVPKLSTGFGTCHIARHIGLASTCPHESLCFSMYL